MALLLGQLRDTTGSSLPTSAVSWSQVQDKIHGHLALRLFSTLGHLGFRFKGFRIIQVGILT